jgi:hypothetical protein
LCKAISAISREKIILFPSSTNKDKICYAHCLKEAEKYQDALATSEKGKQLGFNLIGAWYYHDAVVSSYNFLDDLPRVLQAVEIAINFFREEESSGNEADHLSRKANILKQIASPLSQREEFYPSSNPVNLRVYFNHTILGRPRRRVSSNGPDRIKNSDRTC